MISNFLMDLSPLALRVDAHPGSHGDVPGDPQTLNLTPQTLYIYICIYIHTCVLIFVYICAYICI